MLTNHSLSECHQLDPTSATDWFTEGPVLCYHVWDNSCDRSLAVVRVGHRVQLEGFCLSLHSLHVLNWDVNRIQAKQHAEDGIVMLTNLGCTGFVTYDVDNLDSHNKANFSQEEFIDQGAIRH